MPAHPLLGIGVRRASVWFQKSVAGRIGQGFCGDDIQGSGDVEGAQMRPRGTGAELEWSAIDAATFAEGLAWGRTL